MKLSTLILLLFPLCGCAQVDMSVPGVQAGSNVWTFDGITRLYSVEPPPRETGNKEVWYDAVLNEYTNQAGKAHATFSYAGKMDIYQRLPIYTNVDGSVGNGWIGPDITPPTGTRISFCGSTKFFCATNPTGNRFFKYDHASGYGVTPINDSTDLLNWQLYAFDPSTNPPPLKVKTEVVSLGWPTPK